LALQDSFVKKEFTPAEQAAAHKAEMESAYLTESGLEGADVTKLRSTMLSPSEAVAAKKEQQTNILQNRGRKKDWDEYVDEKRRMGRVLHHSEIISKLKKLIPSLICADGATPNSISLYYYNPRAIFMNGQKRGGLVNIGWIQGGWNPEYEIDVVDDVGRAIGQKRGWRTLLLRLICLKDEFGTRRPILTEQQANEHFGYPSNGQTASNYRAHLWRYRHEGEIKTLM
jgi:hypothetical protein